MREGEEDVREVRSERYQREQRGTQQRRNPGQA